MEEIPITRAYLESLTTVELSQMADKLGVDIPFDLPRIFIIGELLEFASLDEEETKAPDKDDLENSALVESSQLPRQYNITFIEAMVRDPFWAFVFWEIKSQEKEQFENDPEFGGYYLKVTPIVAHNVKRGNHQVKINETDIFTVPVKPEDTAWYLCLTPAVAKPSQYKVEICVNLKGEETVLAVSNPIKLPGLPEIPARHEMECQDALGNPLIRLSGYGDFHILRKNERLLREKRGAVTGSYE